MTATGADPHRCQIGLEAGTADLSASITAILEDKHMLLVLDNCGHVIEAIATFAARVLRCARQHTYLGDQPLVIARDAGDGLGATG